eukprot:scaffold21458_cov167-Amphora_coffeaeformis.AAC.3
MGNHFREKKHDSESLPPGVEVAIPTKPAQLCSAVKPQDNWLRSSGTSVQFRQPTKPYERPLQYDSGMA